MNWSLMLESVPALLYGALATVQLLLMTLVCGALLALPLGIVAANGRPIIRLPVMGYITFFRGTPLLVQVFLVYYGFSQFQIIRSSIFWPVLREAWFCALLTLALHTAAYTANILRGAILAIPAGQKEAAVALGMRPLLIYRLVILPQALRIGMPAYGNEMISMMKATSLASTITIMELTGTANTIVARTYAPYEVFISAALVYLSVAWMLSRLVRAIEARLSRHMRPAGEAQNTLRRVPAHA
ncbi:ABC transporter permease [Ensifer sp. Root423]|uniref:ABC transporter permease n=1 Tax=Ensifer sp. Root423 TaxID=1736534 RepID=UPI0007130675|nr:ABC transporter permease [Ensifer sp. Root423]KQX16646.1 ABC transporter permease [Ensifer sp. Root423]